MTYSRSPSQSRLGRRWVARARKTDRSQNRQHRPTAQQRPTATAAWHDGRCAACNAVTSVLAVTSGPPPPPLTCKGSRAGGAQGWERVRRHRLGHVTPSLAAATDGSRCLRASHVPRRVSPPPIAHPVVCFLWWYRWRARSRSVGSAFASAGTSDHQSVHRRHQRSPICTLTCGLPRLCAQVVRRAAASAFTGITYPREWVAEQHNRAIPFCSHAPTT